MNGNRIKHLKQFRPQTSGLPPNQSYLLEDDSLHVSIISPKKKRWKWVLSQQNKWKEKFILQKPVISEVIKSHNLFSLNLWSIKPSKLMTKLKHEKKKGFNQKYSLILDSITSDSWSQTEHWRQVIPKSVYKPQIIIEENNGSPEPRR